MRRILLALTATSVIVAGSYLVRPATTAPTPDPQPAAVAAAPAPPAPPPQGKSVEVPAELDRLIEVFERRTADSIDALDFRTLGGHYSTRASITGDIVDYVRAAEALRTAHDLAPTDRAGQIAYAQASASIHDFATALRVAEQAIAADSDDADALAIAGDAAAELGDLERTRELYDRLDTVAPDHPAVLVRLAGFAHLTGAQDEAIALTQLAGDIAQERGEQRSDRAFYPLLLSDLLLDAGRYDEAVDAAHSAIDLDPSAGLGHASLGRALSHAGDFPAAIAAYEKALTIQNDPGWNAALGDLYLATGQPARAEARYSNALTELESGRPDIVGQELAALYADLDRNADKAVELAEGNLAARRGIEAHDTLAWALYRSGDFEAARTAIDEARSTGAQDAGLLYHSGVIAAAQGDTAHAIAELSELLERNPGFHPIFSSHATELLASLTG